MHNWKLPLLTAIAGSIVGFLSALVFVSKNDAIKDGRKLPASGFPQEITSKAPLQANTNDQKSARASSPEISSPPPDLIVIPTSIAASLKFNPIIPMSDKLNYDGFYKIGLKKDQIDAIAKSFAIAILEIQQAEKSILKTEPQDDGTIVLHFPANSPEISKSLVSLRDSIKSVVSDGRSEIIYQNLAKTSSIGYSSGEQKELKVAWVNLPDGRTLPTILDNRISADPDTGTEVGVSVGLSNDYFLERYSPVLQANQLRFEEGLIKK